MRCFVIRYDRNRLLLRHLPHLALVLAALATGVSAGAAQRAWGERSVGRVRAVPGHLSSGRIVAARAAKTRCIGVDHVAGAIVFGDRAVELSMNGGSRWRMTFAQACPALSFYQGFYYRRAVAGKLCAGRDAVIARSGGECPIDTIVKVGPSGR
jgi:hypothetical protein